jgi:hypothetical protein
MTAKISMAHPVIYAAIGKESENFRTQIVPIEIRRAPSTPKVGILYAQIKGK